MTTEIHDTSEKFLDNIALRVMNLANDTKISKDNSLLRQLKRQWFNTVLINVREVSKHSTCCRIPFDSTIKLMTTIHQLKTVNIWCNKVLRYVIEPCDEGQHGEVICVY